MTGRIFINYRRSDAQGAAGRLFDRLLQHFPREQLFMDVDAIEPGVDFTKSIDDQLVNCCAFICVIGPGWATAHNPDGRRRLDDPADYVRIEIEAALARDVRVIPALVDGAVMPHTADLPAALAPLARRNAVQIAHHRFAADCDNLAHGIKRAIGLEPAAEPRPTAAPMQPAPAAAQPAGRLTWPEVFLSFRGRIARGRYFVALLVLLTIFIIAMVSLWGIVDSIFAGGILADHDALPADLRQKLDTVQEGIALVITLLLLWPNWALTLKRLHDLGYGWLAFLPIAALDGASSIMDVTPMKEYSTQVLMFSLGIGVMLAALKGNAGPNAYGPDPLAKPPGKPNL